MDFEFTPKLGLLMIGFGLLSFIPWIVLTMRDKINKTQNRVDEISKDSIKEEFEEE